MSTSPKVIPLRAQKPPVFIEFTEAWHDRWHEDSRLTHGERTLVTRLSRYFNRQRFQRTAELWAWPGWATLIAQTRLSKASVFRGLRRLEELGAIKILHGGRDTNTGWKLPNKYNAILVRPGCRMKPGQVAGCDKARLQDETRLPEVSRLADKKRLAEEDSRGSQESRPALINNLKKGEFEKKGQEERKPVSPSEGPLPSSLNPTPPISARPPSPLVERWGREGQEDEATIAQYRSRMNGGGP